MVYQRTSIYNLDIAGNVKKITRFPLTLLLLNLLIFILLLKESRTTTLQTSVRPNSHLRPIAARAQLRRYHIQRLTGQSPPPVASAARARIKPTHQWLSGQVVDLPTAPHPQVCEGCPVVGGRAREKPYNPACATRGPHVPHRKFR